MMQCPFCGADVSADSAPLRDGRCPRCSSILTWTAEQSAADTRDPRLLQLIHEPSKSASDSSADLSMKEILRTIVHRGAAVSTGSTTAATSPKSSAPPATRPPVPTMERSAAARTPIPGDAPSPDKIDGIWRESITVASRPQMTIKAQSQTPETETPDLLIRPFRLSEPRDPPGNGAEYELQEVIGEGGVGVVYAARQASIDRTVAVKMLKQDYAHKRDHRGKFLSEAVVTGELDHPNIVPIYDVGTSDLGSLFYAMKRVRGTPWSEVIRQQPLAENMRVLMSVADAIAFAHSRGIIHRDLKPENVMLGDFGEVLVMDWGIALSTTAFVKSGRISQTTSMGGTPAYMAPEMATGPLDAIGPASDVYLLGAILYEIVAGQPPHSGKDVMACLYAAAHNEIQPADNKGELLDIAMQAMATRPPDRFASVQDFQAAIREYQSHSESIVLSTRAAEELVRAHKSLDYQDFAGALYAFQEARELWTGNDHARLGEIRTRIDYAKTALRKEDFELGISLLDEHDPEQGPLRRKLVAAQRERAVRQARLRGLRNVALTLAAAIFLVVTVGLVWIANQKSQIESQRDELQAQKVALQSKTVELEQSIATRDGALNQLQTKTNELGQEKVKLESTNTLLRQAKADADAQAQNARDAQEDEAGASYLAQIGVASERISNNSFLDAERLLADYQPDRSPWAFFRHWEWGHLKHLCNLTAGQEQLGSRIEAFTRSGNGNFVAAGSASGKVSVWQVDWTQAKLKALVDLTVGGPVRALALNSDGGRLAVADESAGAILLYDLRQSTAGGRLEPSQRLPVHAAGAIHLAFSPHNDQLLSSSRDGLARLWDLKAGNVRQSFAGHSGPVWMSVFSPAGDQVATAGDDATVRLWRIGERQPRTYRGHAGPVYAVAWSPRADWIASAGHDRSVHVWSAAKDLEIKYESIRKQLERDRRDPEAAIPIGTFHTPEHLLNGHAAEIHALSFSDDGVYVLSGANDNTLRRWNFRVGPSSPDWVTVFRGHGGWVRGCVFAPDSRFVASGSLDALVKIWDARQYEEVRALRGHDDAVLWAALSTDGEKIVTAGRDRQAIVWSAQSREPLLVLDEGEETEAASLPGGTAARLKEGHEYLVTAAAFFPDRRRVVTSAGDGTVRLWDVESGGQLRRLAHTGTQGVLALSPNGRWIVTGSDAQTRNQQGALVWDADHLEMPPVPLAAHPAEVSALAIVTEGEQGQSWIATGDILGNLRLWRLPNASGTWQLVGRLPGHAAGYPITAIAFSPDGRRVYSASHDRTVTVHDTASGQLLPQMLRHEGGIKTLQISKSGSLAITLCSPAKGTYRVSAWDLTTGSQRSCDVSLPNESLTSVVFHPNQESAVLTSTSGNRSRFWRWDLTSPALAPLWPDSVLRGTVWSAVYSPDGARMLALGGSRGRLLKADSGELEKTFSPHGPLTAANFSPSGRLAATSSLDGDVKLWHVDPAHPQRGRVALKIAQPHGAVGVSSAVNFVAFSPLETDQECSLATAGSDGTAQLWQIAGNAATCVHKLRGHQGKVRSALFSPDGRLVLTAAEDKSARLWEVATGLPLATGESRLAHKENVLFATFSPDGGLVITGCDDNNAYLWNLSNITDGPVRVLQGHTAAVTSAAIAPDNRRAITGSQDGIAKLWDIETGREILSLKRHAAELTSVHFSANGGTLVTSSLDGTALVWPSANIGPSVKLSAGRLEIPRSAGTHPIDPLAQVLGPDAGDLAGGTLRVSILTSAGGPGTELDISTADLEVEQQRILFPAQGQSRPVAEFIRSGEPTSSLQFRFLAGVSIKDAQRLLRAVALHTTQALPRPIQVECQLEDARGLVSNLAEATVQSADAAGAPAELAVSSPESPALADRRRSETISP